MPQKKESQVRFHPTVRLECELSQRAKAHGITKCGVTRMAAYLIHPMLRIVQAWPGLCLDPETMDLSAFAKTRGIMTVSEDEHIFAKQLAREMGYTLSELVNRLLWMGLEISGAINQTRLLPLGEFLIQALWYLQIRHRRIQ